VDDEIEPDNYNTLTFTFGTPPSPLWTTSDYAYEFMIRGYCTSIISSDPPTDPDPMPNYSNTYFGDYYTYTDGFGEYVKIREAIQERALWAARENPPDTFAVGFYDMEIPTYFLWYFIYPPQYLNSGGSFRTGFSYAAQDPFSTGIDGYPYGISDYTFAGGSSAYLDFSGQVAWVDVNNSGNPFDPANRIFIGLIFAQGNDPVIISTLNSTDIATSVYTSANPLGVNFELELAGGVVVSCPLYWFMSFDPSTGASIFSATNFRLKATKWWPYAKDSPAVPVWDTNTGLKI
jgi:hypothetical protein